ncbi:hypothetical protein [Mycobacteroides abscessus]|uniref:hypothetical protein n=1 Tax=Mycobacteroides abscessus TaxID=36809 RepID=UPI0005787E3F|nr:hypothetical protein [Mycobacteroides abscessus]PVA77167.1 hypothetical protein DDJ37_00230 [Mycobacteroides abscessus]PVB10706.1 hypothetical protein DDJ71_25875 [Mycobacteroides abscessus]PVB18630.1 hypothetical protein DDJ40_01935 [Mycobacteroides abscessus]RIR11312.1 hypothetical protein D2E27_17245 [Mycobacteroides abscessus]RIS05396.1 hypothetical protein D2E58_04320 [Mycobacteroides abscessus]
MTDDTQPSLLEGKYRAAALALADLAEDDQPDTDFFHPWGRGGRLWQAGRYALIALRRRADRGVDDLNEDERVALDNYANYEQDIRTLEAETYLSHAHFHALKALRAEYGLDLEWVGNR